MVNINLFMLVNSFLSVAKERKKSITFAKINNSPKI